MRVLSSGARTSRSVSPLFVLFNLQLIGFHRQDMQHCLPEQIATHYQITVFLKPFSPENRLVVY